MSSFNKRYSLIISSLLILLFFIVSSFLILTFCSTCSFIYPLNVWDDSNCFFTVGKSVLSGKAIYRDMFEQKGPYLYFLHTLAAIISCRSFIGIFIFEVISATVFLYYSYKTLCLYTDKNVIFLLPLFLAFCFSAPNFNFGDSAEEFALPLLAYPMYITLRNIKLNFDYNKKDLIFTGICAGLIFFSKFTIVGFFIGFALLPLFTYLKNRKYKELLFCVLYVSLGVLITFIPLLLYFGITGSLGDFFKVYFYNNLFLYSGQTTANQSFIHKCIDIVKNVKTSLSFSGGANHKLYVLSILSVVFAGLYVDRKNILNLILMFGFTVLFAFGFGFILYYGIIIDAFLIFSLIGLNNIIIRSGKKISFCIYPVLIILGLAISYKSPFHRNLRFVNKSELPQYKFAEIINKKENATLLNYDSLDQGFYTTTGIVPSTKYFCKLNINIPEMYKGQEDMITNKAVDFIVCRHEINSADYELISTADNLRPGQEGSKYFLYKAKE